MGRFSSLFERQETTAKLRAVDLTCAMIEFTPDGQIITCNDNYLKLFGYELQELVGQHHSLFLPPGERATPAYQAFWQGLRAGDSVSAELRRVAKGGREIWLQASYTPVRDSHGNLTRIIKLATDATERHRLEAGRRDREHALEKSNADLHRLAASLEQARVDADDANRAKSRFLAGMSHELRTPLNGLLGYAQLLRMEGGLTPHQLARVDAMLRAGNHLLQMINSVLDISQIEADKIAVQATEVDLRELMQACIELVMPGAEAKQLTLTSSLAANVPAQVVADHIRLRQVLLNLLGNAVKFTPRGNVELRAKQAGAKLRFEVADTGPGVPEDQRHRLFQAFDRLDSDAARNEEGNGLGLALSARLAEVMNGTLGHEDNPAGGSVFWLELPLVAVATPAPAPAPALATEPAPNPVMSLRVLIVDDVAMNRDIAAAFLQSAGHTVTHAAGGAEAVAAVESQSFDVIMMDLRMPGMDGLEATRRIRALGGTRSQVPIVALTAQVFTEQLAQCRAAGMDDHVAKPFTRPALLDALTRVAGKWQNRRENSPAPDSTQQADALLLAAEQLPILSQSAFDRTVALLDSRAIGAYLNSLAEKVAALLDVLRVPGVQGPVAAEAAHALAGSAGLFGFERLVAIARGFEHAAQSGASEHAALREALATTLAASLGEIQIQRETIALGREQLAPNVVSINARHG